MTMRTTRRRALPALALTLSLALLASACSSDAPSAGGPSDSPTAGGSTSPGSDSSSPDAEPTPTNYLEVPKGVVLTPQGTDLGIPGKGSVAWQLDAKRVAVLDIKVLKVERVPLATLKDWVLDKRSKESTPYFVRVSLANVGRADLGGLVVPLYAELADDTLVSASSFQSAFKPCPSTPLPAKFKKAATVRACLVYLAPDHGKMTNVSFYPGPGFEPVTWTGKIDQPKKDKKKDKKKQQ